MKTHWVYLLLLLPAIAMAENTEELRYKGYSFEPRYGSEADDFQAAETISPNLKDWQKIEQIKSISIGNNILSAYRITLNEKNAKPYLEYRDPRLIKGLPFEPSDYHAVSLVANNKVNTLLKQKYDLFPTGHYGRDYYGCIEMEPVFAAPLIEGRAEAFFSITGRGHYTDSSIYDRHTLNIYGSINAKLHLTEQLFIANYIVPLHAIDEKNTHQYDYPAATMKKRKGHHLLSKDNRGRKQYAKFYAADFDENNKLDLIFWHRQYMSTETAKSQVGMTFEKEWFTAYEENATADGFNKITLSVEQGHKMLETAGVGWKDGYPKDNTLCPDNLKYIPMMPLIFDKPDIRY